MVFGTVTVDSLPLGRRILVTGSSCSGKSTLGSELARALSIPFVELDAINWQPDWVALTTTDPEEFVRRVTKATEGDEWVVSGSYFRHSKRVFWSRLDTVVWLDFPMLLLIGRLFVRTWRRARSKDLLWGKNQEQFWPLFKVWDKEQSLLAWVVLNHRGRRRRTLESIDDPQWKHIRFIRISSVAGVQAFRRSLGITGPPRHRD